MDTNSQNLNRKHIKQGRSRGWPRMALSPMPGQHSLPPFVYRVGIGLIAPDRRQFACLLILMVYGILYILFLYFRFQVWSRFSFFFFYSYSFFFNHIFLRSNSVSVLFVFFFLSPNYCYYYSQTPNKIIRTPAQRTISNSVFVQIFTSYCLMICSPFIRLFIHHGCRCRWSFHS